MAAFELIVLVIGFSLLGLWTGVWLIENYSGLHPGWNPREKFFSKKVGSEED